MIFREYELEKKRFREAWELLAEVLTEKAQLFARTQPQAIRSDKEKVSGGEAGDAFSEYLIAKERNNIDARLEEAKRIVDDGLKILELKEKELRRSRRLHDEVYTMRYLDGKSASEISNKKAYSRGRIYQILAEISKELDRIRQS